MARFTLLALGVPPKPLQTAALSRPRANRLSSIGGLPRSRARARGEEQPLLPIGHCQHGSGAGGHPLRSEGHVHLPGHGLSSGADAVGDAFPADEPVMVCGGAGKQAP